MRSEIGLLAAKSFVLGERSVKAFWFLTPQMLYLVTRFARSVNLG